jgi:uncharacterized protein (DUF2141 family)
MMAKCRHCQQKGISSFESVKHQSVNTAGVIMRYFGKMSYVWLAMVACDTAFAADLIVKVSGISQPHGVVGCSLFKDEQGFPLNSEKAVVKWVAASSETVVCEFKEIPPGKYAVAVGHDVNGNKVVDTNIFGVPKEQWGVSNNIRPALRAPKFEEAAFSVMGDVSSMNIEIKVQK